MKYIGLIMALFLVLGCKPKDDSGNGNIPGVPAPGGQIDPPDPVNPLPGLVSFQAFESEALADLTSLASVQQLNARYITVCDQYNAGSMSPVMRQAVQKGINQISLESNVEPGQWIGEFGCTLRIDLRDYGLTPSKWRIIEAADPLRFESQTDRGQLIKQLTQARRSWMHGSNFLETALVNETYYSLLEIPNELGPFLDSYLGCDLQRDFDDFSEDLFLAAVRRSLIALQKNRVILATECREGLMSSTYDFILEGQTSIERSISINPFPLEARSGRSFNEDAQEFIFKLPNQMLGYALFANQLRENFAPTNIVTNTNATIDPTIRNARSCSQCHASGYLPVDDFIADHVRGNPNFTASDSQKAQAYYGRNAGMKAALAQANQRFQAAVSSLDIDINSPDPINALTDRIRIEMDAAQVAGMLFMNTDEFINALRSSAGGSLAIGQLITGGTISFQDLVLIAPILVQDLNLFQDDLGG